MRSKGNKKEYICPCCNATDIVKCVSVFDTVNHVMMGMYSKSPSFYCYSCTAFGPWQLRGNCSLKKPLPPLKSPVIGKEFSSVITTIGPDEYVEAPRESITIYSMSN